MNPIQKMVVQQPNLRRALYTALSVYRLNEMNGNLKPGYKNHPQDVVEAVASQDMDTFLKYLDEVERSEQ